MSINKTPVSSITKINGHLFLGAVQTMTAVWLWPSSLDWWGLGVLSVLLGLSALAGILAALRDMLTVYTREKEIARFHATSRAPEPSDLADQDALRNAGMIDG